MPKYDVTDEAIINASPAVVYQALIDEMDGKTDWWHPYHITTLRDGDSFGQVGAIHDTAIRVHGSLAIHFAAKTAEVKANEMIRLEYIEGSLLGECIWRFEEVDGKTKLSYQWMVSTAGFWRSLFAHMLPYARSHSKTMEKGYKQLNEYLEQRS